MARTTSSSDIVVQTTGEVLESSRLYVRKQVAAFTRRMQGRLSSATVKLTWSTKASAPFSALAQANLDIEGQLIRAQVAATFFIEAGRRLRARLTEQAARLADPAAVRPWPADPSTRTSPEGRPGRAGEIVRRKYVPLARCTPDRAALTMDVMDYDFHLFVDADTGEDSVVYRVGPTGYRLARLSSVAPPAPPVTTPFTINVQEVPLLTSQQAVKRLETTRLPFRFFQDASTGRGSVLYRRFDGDYGLITAPAAGPDGAPATTGQS